MQIHEAPSPTGDDQCPALGAAIALWTAGIPAPVRPAKSVA